jgi:hypothetical protein
LAGLPTADQRIGWVAAIGEQGRLTVPEAWSESPGQRPEPQPCRGSVQLRSLASRVCSSRNTVCSPTLPMNQSRNAGVLSTTPATQSSAAARKLQPRRRADPRQTGRRSGLAGVRGLRRRDRTGGALSRQRGRTGRPLTPTLVRKRDPASGSSRVLMFSCEVVMNNWSRCSPPKVQAVTFRAGTASLPLARRRRVAVDRTTVGHRRTRLPLHRRSVSPGGRPQATRQTCAGWSIRQRCRSRTRRW